MDHQVAEGRRQADAVLELGQLLAVGVGHRGAEVHRQVAGEVRLGLELFEVILVGLGVDVPVEVLEVVAGGVPAVLGEFHGKAVEGTGVQAGEEALDDELGAQVEPRHLADDFRTQVFFGGGHDAIVTELVFLQEQRPVRREEALVVALPHAVGFRREVAAQVHGDRCSTSTSSE